MNEEHFNEIGRIGSEMMLDRAEETAFYAGRQIIWEDDERALRELTAGGGIDRYQALLESLSEEERWGPIPHAATGAAQTLTPDS